MEEGSTARSGLVQLRLALYGTILVLALIRFWLNPPMQTSVVLVLATWYFTAAIFFALRPRQATSGHVQFLLSFAFFVYEVLAATLVMSRLGGTGWLTILVLLFPALELNALFPGRRGFAGSLIAALAITGMATLEAAGRLPHDPFYSVGDPLYREFAYVIVVFIVSAFVLIGIPAALGRART